MDNDTIVDDFGRDPSDDTPRFKPKDKFRFTKKEWFMLGDTVVHVVEIAGDYVTINVDKHHIGAVLLAHMDVCYDAIYNGPMMESVDGTHLTFKRKV